jgi:uncharacterized repeat protein (TIGR01451 family)
MTRRIHLLSLSVLAVVATAATAQLPAPPPPPLPLRGPSALLFLRFVGPAGMRVTYYPGTRMARSFDAPAIAGVRAGYLIRARLDLPGDPGLVLFPTVEVHGALWLGAKVNPADYPAPVVLTDADLENIRAGTLVTKAIYLENPEIAAPFATKPDAPLEYLVAPDRDLLGEARRLGRPIAVVRFGGRAVPAEELARFAVPGTVLMPGEHALSPAACPPCLPLADRQFLDPIAGPRPPEEECLKDGGDIGLRAGLDADGQLRGVDPSDTVAEYTDARGYRHVVCSNRVCVCVPRFGVLRCETPVGRYDGVIAANDARVIHGQEQMKLRVPPIQAGQIEAPQAVRMRERPSAWVGTTLVARAVRVEVLQAHTIDVGLLAAIGTRAAYELREVDRVRLIKQLELARVLSQREGVRENDQVQVTSVVARVQNGPEVVSAAVEARDFTVCCNEAPRVPDKPLVLVKCADRPCAKVGDIVTFTLRYSNHGGRPLTDVAVSDSLTPRLEYISGSARADRDAVFTSQENEAGSMLLRWEVTGKLLPGESGTVQFQARVR